MISNLDSSSKPILKFLFYFSLEISIQEKFWTGKEKDQKSRAFWSLICAPHELKWEEAKKETDELNELNINW